MPVSLVQHIESLSPVANPSIAFRNTVTAGNRLVATVAQEIAAIPGMPSDGSDTFFYLNGTVHEGGSALGIGAFMAMNAVGGHKTNVTFNTAAASLYGIAEFSGTAGQQPDGSLFGSSSSVGWVSDPTPLEADIFVGQGGYALVYLLIQGGSPALQTPGWTILNQQPSGPNTFVLLGQPSTAEQVLSAVWTAPEPYSAVIAAYAIN